MCLGASQLAGEDRWYGLTFAPPPPPFPHPGAAGSELESSEPAALSVSLFPASHVCFMCACLSAQPAYPHFRSSVGDRSATLRSWSQHTRGHHPDPLRRREDSAAECVCGPLVQNLFLGGGS